MNDLLSLVLTLQPLEVPAGRGEFPHWWGRAAQAVLLDIVQQRDAALAGQLHANPQAAGNNHPAESLSTLRPYTVSTLMGRFKKLGAPDPAQVYALRFTALTAELVELMQGFAATAAGCTLELDHLPFRVLAVTDQTAQQPWAGLDSYAGLGARFLSADTLARRVNFQFTSPVVFKSGGLSQPLPTPALLFHSLLERWNAFAPLAFAPEVRRYVEECLAVSRFRLQSQSVSMKEGGLRIGAIGQLTLTTTNPDRFWLGQIHTLAAFARFAGLGAGTAQGLGQARAVELGG